MDSGCYLRNCTLLTEQAPKIKNLCNVPDTVHEDIDGCEFNLLHERVQNQLICRRDG